MYVGADQYALESLLELALLKGALSSPHGDTTANFPLAPENRSKSLAGSMFLDGGKNMLPILPATRLGLA